MKKIIMLATIIVTIFTVGCGRNNDTEGLSIAGAWIYAFSTFGDDDISIVIPEFYDIPPLMEIDEGGTLTAWFIGGRHHAMLVPTDANEFLMTERTGFSEGEYWYIEDELLRYYPESGLLRWTSYNPFSERYEHRLFKRN